MRGGTFGSIAIATVCGVATAYVTLQPGLQQQKEEKDGTFQTVNSTDAQKRDTLISQAIISDFKEAKRDVTDISKGGFAWGIRNALFGGRKKDIVDSSTHTDQTATEKPSQTKS